MVVCYYNGNTYILLFYNVGKAVLNSSLMLPYITKTHRWLQHIVGFLCSHSWHPHLLKSLSSPSLFFFLHPPHRSCLDNITAYYFSYFHPSLFPYRPVSQAVMCDLELPLTLWVSGTGVRWLVYWDVTGGVTLNKPTSPLLTPSFLLFLKALLGANRRPLWVWGLGGLCQVGCATVDFG